MSLPGRLLRGLYPRFLGWVLGLAMGLAVLGWWPTRQWAGSAGLEAMLAALVVSVLASAVGGLPLTVANGDWTGLRLAPHQVATAALAGIGLRLLVAAGLGFVVLSSGRFAATPLVLWLGLSYVALLVVDTIFALRAFRAQGTTER